MSVIFMRILMEPTAVKGFLAGVFSSIGEFIAWLETDPAVLSAMPHEMASIDINTFEADASNYLK